MDYYHITKLIIVLIYPPKDLQVTIFAGVSYVLSFGRVIYVLILGEHDRGLPVEN